MKRDDSSPRTTIPERMLTTKEAAAMLGLSPATLEAWRCSGRVRLPFLRLGRSVKYRLSDLYAYLDRAAAQASEGA